MILLRSMINPVQEIRCDEAFLENLLQRKREIEREREREREKEVSVYKFRRFLRSTLLFIHWLEIAVLPPYDAGHITTYGVCA